MDAGRTAIGVCFAIVAISAIWDLASRHIPNILTLGGIALGIARRVALGYTDAGWGGAMRGLAWAVAGIGLCGLLPLLSYVRKEVAAGDVKLFAAIGALCGPALGMNTQAWTYAVIILVVWPLRLVRNGVLRQAATAVCSDLANMFRSRDRRVAVTHPATPTVPMGPSIFAGMFVALTIHGVFQ